jgi:dTDP-4-amino-4,6-dideoxygalactose transaminase
MELTLRLLGVREGDEVITSPYTYSASGSVIEHVGAKIVLVDTEEDSYEMNYDKLEEAINERTKAIIPVDLAGMICDYDRLYAIVKAKMPIFRPTNPIQEVIGRIALIADSAHAFGSVWHGKRSGSIADFTCFSFHAVKNLTTAEGGAVTWRDIDGISSDDLYREYMLLSLHGQSKDALAKSRAGAWEYDILHLGYKYNMTDITASIGWHN